jgi:hypothetical protein
MCYYGNKRADFTNKCIVYKLKMSLKKMKLSFKKLNLSKKIRTDLQKVMVRIFGGPSVDFYVL